MHPAPSIILFTVLSGLGFGILFFLGFGQPAPTGWAAFGLFALGGGAAAAGLVASVFHLGHPERALKAFSQWRSSWLSREGWAATATLLVAAAYGANVVFFSNYMGGLGLILALLSALTVAATSMIYAQLATVPRWNRSSTPLTFLMFMLTGGAIATGQTGAAAVLSALLGLTLIAVTWSGDTRFAEAGHTLATATGLGGRGTVRAFEPPHTGTSYLLNEMVHIVGRRHARQLRVIGIALAAGAPLAILLASGSAIAHVVALAAHIAGALCLRWLFFAEAEHVVGLYYGKR